MEKKICYCRVINKHKLGCHFYGSQTFFTDLGDVLPMGHTNQIFMSQLVCVTLHLIKANELQTGGKQSSMELVMRAQ